MSITSDDSLFASRRDHFCNIYNKKDDANVVVGVTQFDRKKNIIM